MGMYAQNNYNLTIPIASIDAIVAEWGGNDWQSGDPYPATPEGLVQLIVDEYGSEDTVEAPVIEDGNVVFIDGSYGKIGDSDRLGELLARHGATGIIYGDCDGYLFMEEFVDGVVKHHGGVIMYPSYTGDLYQP